MKSAQQATQKWTTSTSVGTETWATNLQGTTKPIVAAAVAQRAVMQTNFQHATAAGGRWQTRLEAIGDNGIKQAAVAKKQNYTTGVQNGEAKFATAIAKIIAYEHAGLPAIYGMPKGSTAAGIARASAWITYMAAGKGTLGA